MPELIAPTAELYASWLHAREEWGPGTHQDGSGLRPADDVDTAAARGLDRVLITCADGNAASARVIERHGGVLEDVRDTELGRTRRYWITLVDQPAASGPVR